MPSVTMLPHSEKCLPLTDIFIEMESTVDGKPWWIYQIGPPSVPQQSGQEEAGVG